jgi:hypothetical protein
LGGLVISAGITRATTIQTNTRPEIAQMAGLWEVDSIQISSLANAQYPAIAGGTNNWQFIFPHTSISSDGDVHNDIAVDSSGTGSTGNNAGESPIIAEVINATSAQLSHLQTIKSHQIKPRGIFRMYTEHAGERHFEIHPITENDAWNGSAFVLDTDYHANIVADANGTTHSASTLANVFNGTDQVTAQVMADNNRIIFTYPSPSVNYVQLGGVALSSLLSDSVSQYFLFSSTSPSVPGVTIRCRIITNTAAAFNATGLASNQAVTVNALTRTDMLVVSNVVAGLSANQGTTFARPVELITFSVSSTGVVSSLPIISNVQVTGITLSNATIQWTTDVSSDSQVLYGTSPPP